MGFDMLNRLVSAIILIIIALTSIPLFFIALVLRLLTYPLTGVCGCCICLPAFGLRFIPG